MKYQGKAIPVFTAPPDWGSGILAFGRHDTIVARALAGNEDRRQRQARMLWSLAFVALTLSARETGYIRGAMLAAQESPVAVPFWPQAVQLAAASSSGASSVVHPARSGAFLFAPGGWALLMEHALRWEVVRIDSAAETVTSFAGALARDWPEGATLVPLLAGHLVRPDSDHDPRAGGSAQAGRWEIDFEEKFLKIEP